MLETCPYTNSKLFAPENVDAVPKECTKHPGAAIFSRGLASYSKTRVGVQKSREINRFFVDDELMEHGNEAEGVHRKNAESDHNLVFGNIRLLGPIAQNRPKRVIKNRRAIDVPILMTDPHLRVNFQEAIAAKLASPIPGISTGSVDDMTSVLTETLLSNAADIAPPIRRKQVLRGWCATEETRAELNAR